MRIKRYLFWWCHYCVKQMTETQSNCCATYCSTYMLKNLKTKEITTAHCRYFSPESRRCTWSNCGILQNRATIVPFYQNDTIYNFWPLLTQVWVAKFSRWGNDFRVFPHFFWRYLARTLKWYLTAYTVTRGLEVQWCCPLDMLVCLTPTPFHFVYLIFEVKTCISWQVITWPSN